MYQGRTLLSFAETLREVQTRRLILLQTGQLWVCCTYVPQVVRSSIVVYRDELAGLIRQSRIEVCPARDLHRSTWRYQHGVFVCDRCAELYRWI